MVYGAEVRLQFLVHEKHERGRAEKSDPMVVNVSQKPIHPGEIDVILKEL